MKAVILYGESGPGEDSPDEADTEIQADFVKRELQRAGWAVETRRLGMDLERAASDLQQTNADIVFNLVEAILGRGDLIHLGPALLEHLDLPFTGASQAALLNTSNKCVAKHWLTEVGVSTPPLWSPAQNQSSGDKWIVKSKWEHGSVGLSAASVVSGAKVATVQKQKETRFGGQWFAEQFIAGREFNVSLLEADGQARILAVAEIDLDALPPGIPRIVDYAAKWDSTSFAYHNTPRRFHFERRDFPLLDQLKQIALKCWELFDLNGYARVDFRVSADGRPWVLEVNANPCLSPDAGFLAAAAHAHNDARSVLETIVQAGLERATHNDEWPVCSSFAP